MSNQVKSNGMAPAINGIKSSCRYLDGFALFEIPKVRGVDSQVVKSVARAVRKHKHVISVELTSLKNLLVVPDERNLRKSSMSYGGFEQEIEELIESTVRYKVATHASKKTKTDYVNDKSRTFPVLATA